MGHLPNHVFLSFIFQVDEYRSKYATHLFSDSHILFKEIIVLQISIHYKFLKLRNRPIKIHGMVPLGPRQDNRPIYNPQRNQADHRDEYKAQSHDAHNGKNPFCNGIIQGKSSHFFLLGVVYP